MYVRERECCVCVCCMQKQRLDFQPIPPLSVCVEGGAVAQHNTSVSAECVCVILCDGPHTLTHTHTTQEHTHTHTQHSHTCIHPSSSYIFPRMVSTTIRHLLDCHHHDVSPSHRRHFNAGISTTARLVEIPTFPLIRPSAPLSATLHLERTPFSHFLFSRRRRRHDCAHQGGGTW